MSEKTYTCEYFRVLWGKPSKYYSPMDSQYSYKNGHYLDITCPFCHVNAPELGPDTSHHCRISPNKNYYFCIRCTKTGTIDKFFESLQYADSKRKTEDWNLADFKGAYILNASEKPKTFYKSPGKTIPLHLIEDDHPAWTFLYKDGFTKEEIETYSKSLGLHLCISGFQMTKYASNTTTNRLIFDIKDEKGEVLSWQARYLTEDGIENEEEKKYQKEHKIQKYLLAPGFSKTIMPYNIKALRNFKTIIVVEGIKKVWKTGVSSIGSYGTIKTPNPTEAHWVNDALANDNRLLVLFDKGAENNAEELVAYYQKMGGEAQVIYLPEEGPKDLDDYSKKQIKEILIKNSTLPIYE